MNSTDYGMAAVVGMLSTVEQFFREMDCPLTPEQVAALDEVRKPATPTHLGGAA